MTDRQRIIGALENGKIRSAALIMENIRTYHQPGDRPSYLSSIASMCRKMWEAGELERIDNCGVRGGYGYKLGETKGEGVK